MFAREQNDSPFPEMTGASRRGLLDADLIARLDWSGMGESEHFAQFYETDDFLLESLSGFIGAGLRAGEAGIVVATREHREGLARRLREYGLDLEEARARGLFVEVDASEALSKFMVDGSPEPGLFADLFQGLVTEAAQVGRGVRIFGEMVAILWAEEQYDTAIRVEALWNGLHATHAFTLFCAYPIDGRGRDGLVGSPIEDVCAEHSHVFPAESYTALTGADERLHAIIHLQQKARLLEAEIAERKEAEERLRISEIRYRRLFEASADAILMVDPATGTIEDVNPASTDLLGSHRNELRGKAIWEIGLFDGPEATRRAFQELHEQRVLRYDHLVLRANDGSPRDVEVVSTIYSANGHQVVQCHIRDITQRKQAEEAVGAVKEELERLLAREQLARAEAESANRMKDEFLATVSHELRTPLTTILGWAYRLRHGQSDETTVAHGLEIIEQSARAQAQLIEDILDVSRVITGKLRLEIGLVDVASVINAAIDSVQLAADSRGIRLAVTLDPSARHILGDAGRLQQVFWNLLSNAIKFTPPGGRIEVRLERAGAYVQIRVSDTGEGISPEVLPFIFERFRQADSSSTRKHRGLGLGLAIVRHLVELHGGTVDAESPGEGHGATFTIRLPFAPAGANATRGEAGSAQPRERGVLPPEAPTSLEGVRILLVDDDPAILELLVATLADAGAGVQTATSAAEALELLRDSRPDVLVSDLAMPGEDGYTLIGAVRSGEAERGRHTPAVALTAYAMVEDRLRVLSAGYNMFVPKPIEPGELIAVIASLVGRGVAEPRPS